MTFSWLLVHSPLLGPSSWGPVEARLAARDRPVVVPDLTVVADASPPAWRRLVEAAVAAAVTLPPPVAVVGHSGAGAFLPAIGGRIGDRLGALVFVDAVVPPPAGAHQTSSALSRLLDDHTVDGRLRPWLDWWPEETVRRLLPAAADRSALRSDLPRLPRGFYDEAVPVPRSWSTWRCAYVRLSPAYQDEFAEAAARGWASRAVDGDHLSPYTDPGRVIAAIEGLLAQP